ncbi:unnamed protein product [Phaeothamnion confervicola]
MPFLGGLALDSADHRRALLGFLSLTLAGHLVFVFAMGAGAFWAALAGEVIFGLGSGTVIVAQRAIVSKFFVGKEIAFALGVTVAIACVSKTIAKATVAPVAEGFNSYMASLWYIALFLVLSLLAGVLYAGTLADCGTNGNCGGSGDKGIGAGAPAAETAGTAAAVATVTEARGKGRAAAIAAAAGGGDGVFRRLNLATLPASTVVVGTGRQRALPLALRGDRGGDNGSGGHRSAGRPSLAGGDSGFVNANAEAGAAGLAIDAEGDAPKTEEARRAAAAAGTVPTVPRRDAAASAENGAVGTVAVASDAGAVSNMEDTLLPPPNQQRARSASSASASVSTSGSGSLHVGHPHLGIRSIMLTVTRSTMAFWALVVLHTLFMMTYHLFSNFSAHFVVENYSLSAVQAGYVTSVMPLVVVFGAPFAGYMLDYCGGQLWVLLAATVVTMWSYALLLREAASPLVCILLLALCESVVPAILLSGLPLVVDPSVYGVAFGLSEVVYAAGLLVGNVYMGWARDATKSYAADLRAVLALCSVCFLLTVALLVWDYRHGNRLNRPRAAYGYKALPT